jgi:heme/copper-type cytochrome/quinol oxidase subunit 2
MINRRPAPLLVLLLLPAFLPAALTLAAGDATKEAPFTVPVDADGVQRATVTLDSYYYSPNHLIVQVNKPVELTLVSESTLVTHDFVIDDPASGLAIKQNVGAGKTVKLSFTPTKTGSFAFYCSKKAPFMASHRAKGMEGVLEVR